MALIRTLDYCHYASIIALQRSGGARFLGSSRPASSLDAGVVGSVDESFDRLARVVQEVRDRGGDQEADWEAEPGGCGAEFGEELVGEPVTGDPCLSAP
jgi:hypothetical protein